MRESFRVVWALLVSGRGRWGRNGTDVRWWSASKRLFVFVAPARHALMASSSSSASKRSRNDEINYVPRLENIVVNVRIQIYLRLLQLGDSS